DGVGGEDFLGGTGSGEPSADVLGGIVRRKGLDRESVGQSREQRAVSSHDETVVEVGQPDQNQRQQGAAVPGVVEQDVQVIECVLVQKVGLVDHQHRQRTLTCQLLDVLAH